MTIKKNGFRKIPQFRVLISRTFSMMNKKDKIPSAIVKVDLTLKRFATVSGKRIFLTPNLMNTFHLHSRKS